jgi:CheY-like chemotaxis protein
MNSDSLLPGLSVLVCEDDDDSREMLLEFLRVSGAAAIGARSAAEALDAFDAQEVDVLVCDIGLPDRDGLSMIRELRERGPVAGGRVPAIALTGRAESRHAEDAISAGFDAHLSKPASLVELCDLIATVHKKANDGRPSSVEGER